MCPEILIGGISLPSWYSLLIAGFVVSAILAVYLKPKDFPLSRVEIGLLCGLVLVFSLLGGRVLFIILHLGQYSFTPADLFSFSGGFAYFGALLFSIAVIWLYSAAKRVNFASLLDYGIPFLMLSQVFVRIGCLMAGCCYGAPTNLPIGMIFKTVDKTVRHPTQAYEALLLMFIYVAGRYIYGKFTRGKGCTTWLVLFMYGAGRFVIESLRVDSPVLFFGLTLAQITCFAIAIVSLVGLSRDIYCQKSGF